MNKKLIRNTSIKSFTRKKELGNGEESSYREKLGLIDITAIGNSHLHHQLLIDIQHA